AWLPAGDFFRVALVVHVDLSVLVWFFAVAGMLWSANAREPRSRLRSALGWAALGLTGAGALGMTLAAFFDPGTPVMANYIPMLESATFRAAVAVFGVGVLALVGFDLWPPLRLGVTLVGTDALRAGLHAGAVATAVALLAFGW